MPQPGVTFAVMAGGRGERLWPLVRSAQPKVCLSPDGSQSLLKSTIVRLRRAWPGAEILVVTTRTQAAAVRAALPPALRWSLVIEPQVRNTAACLTLAAAYVAARDPGRVLVAVPADHWVGDSRQFTAALRAAIRSAWTLRTIATIGIRPTHAHAGLGYLQVGPRVGSERSVRVFELKRFIEKPASRLAGRLVARRGVYWNSGLFVAPARTFLEAIERHLPGHARALVKLIAGLRRPSDALGGAFPRRAARTYRTLRAVSFDRAVMSRSRGAVVVEGRFRWADLGSWDAWARIGRQAFRSLGVESQNVTVLGTGHHLVATVGVRDLVVVHTPSATLICRRDRAQAVRQVVKQVLRDPDLARYR